MTWAARNFRLIRPLAILVLPILLIACAPKLQPLGPVVTTPAFGADRLVMDDGVALPLRHWPAEGKTKAVVLAVHGFNDYSHAFEQPAQDWAKLGIETYAFDQRGFGATPYHGLWAGDRRLVAPAVWSRKQLGPVATGALWFFAHTIPWYTLDGRGLRIEPSDNRQMLEALFHDPLIIKATRIDTVYGVVGLMDRAWAAAPRMPARTLVLYGAREQVIDDTAAAAMLRELPRGPVGPRIAIYSQGYHMLLRDLNADVVRQDIAVWILNPAAPLPSGAETQAQKILELPKVGLAAGS